MPGGFDAFRRKRPPARPMHVQVGVAGPGAVEAARAVEAAGAVQPSSSVQAAGTLHFDQPRG